MDTSKDIQTRRKSELQSQGEQEVFLRPAVDIYEDDKGITLIADLPGVSRDRLNLQLEGETLSIEGEMVVEMPEGMEALYADVKTTRFRRSFTLSRELESDQIHASMKDGVLTLQLPKRAELQPRRIEISAA
ncbi:Hsp20/alpha crystallin family protein [Marinobacterium aestuariivivens]|uniref:Hsp20/alpha crystallin family protein n=1 Tax=Marinobacterium aestuariivivens TaxID=1698799 RepID=A0ABW2A3U5_9GAMM